GALQLVISYGEQKTVLVQLQQEKAAVASARISQFVDETVRQIKGALPPGPATSQAARDDRRTELLRLLRLAPAITELRYIDSAGHERDRISRVSINVEDSLED